MATQTLQQRHSPLKSGKHDHSNIRSSDRTVWSLDARQASGQNVPRHSVSNMFLIIMKL